MISGLYAAGLGMMALEQRQDTVANNIANASTPGYKRQYAVDKGFYQLLYQRSRDPFWANRVTAPGGGLQLNETYTDFASGPITTTENPLDVALRGNGYLAVNTPEGERYTRDGAMRLDTTGQIVNSDGYPVLDEVGQPIVADGSKVEINADGTVIVDGQATSKLRITEFQNPGLLQRAGKNLLSASPEALQQSAPATETTLISGAIEQSNVQLPTEMISMILGVRHYEANQKVINTIDETMNRLIDQVGMPG